MPSAKESVLLYSFLKKNLSKKVMVLFSSCNSVKYHSELLGYIKVDCLDIHGKQKQQKRTSTFFDFCKVEKGILLCTDVAARGLEIPDGDWMRQKVSKVKSDRGTHSCMACMVTSGPHATYCSITFDFVNVFSNLILRISFSKYDFQIIPIFSSFLLRIIQESLFNKILPPFSSRHVILTTSMILKCFKISVNLFS